MSEGYPRRGARATGNGARRACGDARRRASRRWRSCVCARTMCPSGHFPPFPRGEKWGAGLRGNHSVTPARPKARCERISRSLDALRPREGGPEFTRAVSPAGRNHPDDQAATDPAIFAVTLTQPVARSRMRSRGPFYVYILANRRNGTLYVGVTNDISRRISEHRAGVGAVFTRRYSVHRLVWMEPYDRVPTPSPEKSRSRVGIAPGKSG